MPANTPNGFPYPLPTEPVADGADAIKALALAIDGKMPGASAIRARYFTALSADSNGLISINGSMIGLTTIAGAVGQVSWASTFDGAAPILSACRVNTNIIQIISFALTAATNASVNRVINRTGINVYVVAWGTP